MIKLWDPKFCLHKDGQTPHHEWNISLGTPLHVEKQKHINTHTHYAAKSSVLNEKYDTHMIHLDLRSYLFVGVSASPGSMGTLYFRPCVCIETVFGCCNLNRCHLKEFLWLNLVWSELNYCSFVWLTCSGDALTVVYQKVTFAGMMSN